MSARWYMAVLVRGSREDGSWDEDRIGDMFYRLVSASNAEEAYARVLELGRAASDAYTDDEGKSVSLEFLGLADLTEISAPELSHGTEVYSQLVPQRPSEMVAQKEELTVFESELGVGEDAVGEHRFVKQ